MSNKVYTSLTPYLVPSW